MNLFRWSPVLPWSSLYGVGIDFIVITGVSCRLLCRPYLIAVVAAAASASLKPEEGFELKTKAKSLTMWLLSSDSVPNSLLLSSGKPDTQSHVESIAPHLPRLTCFSLLSHAQVLWSCSLLKILAGSPCLCMVHFLCQGHQFLPLSVALILATPSLVH